MITTTLSVGFIPLIDAAPLIVAHEMGFAAEESIALDAEGVEGHLVVSGARSGVVGMQLADRIERGFLPEAGEVKDAKRAGDAGGDEGDDLAHVR